jgi:small subunit ribosomal protein S16
MAVKIRLQRHGKKGKPFYQIVAADARSKRDGRYIERLGSYNPNTNPATILLDNDRALYWLTNGAIPTDTARAILSYKGVVYMNHLRKGVLKGALTQEQADKKFNEWLSAKEAKIQAKRDNLSAAAEKELADRMTREREIQETRAREIAAANAPVVEEVAEEAPAAEVEAIEEAPAAEVEATEEAPAAEVEATEEAPAAEVEATEEAPAAEVEATEEAPAAEESTEDEKKAE